jgi:hypothetical protein
MPEILEQVRSNRLQLFAIWAEIVAAIAVVFSLIFVGLQIRQGAAETALNTRTAQVNAYQELQAQITTMNVLELQDAELRRVLTELRGGATLESPDDSLDVRLYVPYGRLWIRMGDLAYYQYQNGLIDETRLQTMLSPLGGEVLRNPVGLALWERYVAAGSLVPEYVEYVREHMRPLGERE